MDQSELKFTKLDRSRPNRPKWTKLGQIGLNRPKQTKWIEMDQHGPNYTKMNRSREEWTKCQTVISKHNSQN